LLQGFEWQKVYDFYSLLVLKATLMGHIGKYKYPELSSSGYLYLESKLLYFRADVTAAVIFQKVFFLTF
jgi:hypothetical protein